MHSQPSRQVFELWPDGDRTVLHANIVGLHTWFVVIIVNLSILMSGVKPAFANEEAGLFDDDVPVVLSASRLIQPISSAPASITVIDSEMIRLSGARSIVDVLRLIPGFQVGRLVNGNPIATYHGLSERYNPRLQLIVDGRPTYVPLYGGIPWSELPIALTDIERIEVTRAPNAATFGPNSFRAVISIITREPAAHSGWLLNSEAGGNEFVSATLTNHGSRNEASYRITVQGERDEGFESIPDRERSKLASVRSHWQLTPMDRLSVDVGAVRGGHTEIETVVEENDLPSYSETTNAYTQLVWERSRSVNDSFRLQYYYNYFDIDDNSTTTFDLAGVTGNSELAGLTVDAIVNRNSRSKRHELEMQRTMRFGKRHRFVYGAALRQDSVEGMFIFNDSDTRYVSTQRLFAHSEYDANRNWLFNSGLMVENNSISDISASPRVSATRRLTPLSQLRLGYSRGIRTPLLLEEQGEVTLTYPVSNGDVFIDEIVNTEGDIKPETTDVIDFGFYYNNPRSRFGLDAKLSYHRLRDLIATNLNDETADDNFDMFVRSYQNRFNYDYSNLELQFEKKYRTGKHFRINYAYSFGEDSVLERRKLVPEHTLSVYGSSALSNGISISGEYYYTSDWIWDDERDESRLNRLDLRLEKQMKYARINISFAVQAELDLGGTVDYLNRNRVDNLYFARFSMKWH